MIISIINLKGGVGKTVTAVHLGASLASRGYATLLVDTDLQHGLTSYFDMDVRGQTTTSQVLLDGVPAREAVRKVREQLWVLPATPHMEIVDRELPHLSGADLRLRRALRPLDRNCGTHAHAIAAKMPSASFVSGKGSSAPAAAVREPSDHPSFDFVLIDCPSGWGAIARNATLSASWLLVPIDCEPAALKSAHETQRKVDELADFYAHELRPSGALLTCWRNTKIARSVADATLEGWEGAFETRIRRTEKINELAAFRETLSDPSIPSSASPVRDDYLALAAEVLKLSQTP